MVTKTIKIDVNKPLYEPIIAKEGDVSSRYVFFNLIDGASPFSLVNRTVRVYAIKADGKEIFNDLTINNATKGYCTLLLTTQMLAIAGDIKAELVIMEGDKKLSTIPFIITVVEAINSDNAILSTNEYSALVETLAKVKFTEEQVERLDKVPVLENKVVKIENCTNCNVKTVKNLVTIVSDDGNIEDFTRLKPLFDRKGIKATFATRVDGQENKASNMMSYSQLKQLQDEGHEIASHTFSHTNLTTVTKTVAEEQLKKSKELLEANGIVCDGIYYPNGVYTTETLELARKYYKYGGATWTSKNGVDLLTNYAPLDLYCFTRTSYGNMENSCNGDKAIADFESSLSSNSWFVICIHGAEFRDTTHGNSSLEGLTKFIDHVKSKGIDIVPTREALKIYGNAIDIGDFKNNYFKISNNGVVDSNTITSQYVIDNNYSSITNDTPITYFEKKKVTVTSFTTAHNPNNFPSSPEGHPAGVLETYRVNGNDDVNFQIFFPSGDPNTFFKRKWTSGVWGKWFTFKDVDSLPVIAPSNNGITVNSPVTDFKYNQISINSFSSNDNSGFPILQNGTLITSRIGSVSTLQFQIWIPVGNDGFMTKRYWTGSAWGSWRNMYSVDKINKTVPITSIAPLTSLDTDVTITGLQTWNNIFVTPCGTQPSDLIMTYFIKAKNTLTIRYYNSHTTEYRTPVQNHSISVVS